jgi:hypothetical protein
MTWMRSLSFPQENDILVMQSYCVNGPSDEFTIRLILYPHRHQYPIANAMELILEDHPELLTNEIINHVMSNNKLRVLEKVAIKHLQPVVLTQGLCCVCNQRPSCVTAIPCGHTVLCEKCTCRIEGPSFIRAAWDDHQEVSLKCPMCRQIASFHRIYMS